MKSLSSWTRFPVIWMTFIIGALGAADALAVQQSLLTEREAAWAGLIITLATAALGLITHQKVTPVAAPKDDNGIPLVPVPVNMTAQERAEAAQRLAAGK
jgi:hypothetical protein